MGVAILPINHLTWRSVRSTSLSIIVCLSGGALGQKGPSLERPATQTGTLSADSEKVSNVAAADQNLESEDLSYAVRIENIVEPPAEYHFSSFGRTDPFLPPSHRRKAKLNRRKSQTQYGVPIVNSMQIPLELLTVRGIWQLANGERRALVIAKNQSSADNFTQNTSDASPNETEEGVVAKVGDLMGPAGKVVEIREASLVTRQYKLLRDGTRSFDEIELPLGGFKAVGPSEDRYIIRPGEKPVLESNLSIKTSE